MAQTKSQAATARRSATPQHTAPAVAPTSAAPKADRRGGAAAKPATATPPSTPPQDPAKPAGSKQASMIAGLRRPEGATVADLMQLTGWLSHSVRGALSGALKRKLGLTIVSTVEPGRGRVYRIADPAPAPEAQTIAAPPPMQRRRPKRLSRGSDAAA